MSLTSDVVSKSHARPGLRCVGKCISAALAVRGAAVRITGDSAPDSRQTRTQFQHHRGISGLSSADVFQDFACARIKVTRCYLHCRCGDQLGRKESILA